MSSVIQEEKRIAKETLRFGKKCRKISKEEIWGAITALIKFYKSIKEIPIIHWSLGKLERAITRNFKGQEKEIFRDLLDKGLRLHEYFYESHFDKETFEERWKEVIGLVRKAKYSILKITSPL